MLSYDMYNLNFFSKKSSPRNQYVYARHSETFFSYEVLAALANIWLVCFLRYKAL